MLRSSLRLWLLAAPYPVAARHQLFMACSVHAPPTVNAVTVNAGALWTRLPLIATSTPPGVFEGRAGTPAWNGRGTAPARQPGLVVRPERLDPLVQLLQPLQRLLEGLHGQVAVFSCGGPAASGASPQLGEVGHLGTFLMATARAKASSIPLMSPK